MNIQTVWHQNITGRGTVVSILDDGIEYTHPDLQRNYVCTSVAWVSIRNCLFAGPSC